MARNKPIGATHIDWKDLSEPGIYGENVIVRFDGPCDEDGDPQGTPEMWSAYNRQFEILEQEALAILAKVGAADWPHDLPDDASEAAKDAMLVMQQLRYLRKRYKQGDMWAVLAHAFELGRFAERLSIRWADPLVTRKRARLAGVDDKVEAKKNRARDRYLIFRDDDPHVSKTKLINRIVNEQNISEKTAREYLEGLK